MWKPPELSVSGGFFLIVGWFAVSCGGEAALLVLSAALLHELGHILALRLSGAGICWRRFCSGLWTATDWQVPTRCCAFSICCLFFLWTGGRCCICC